MSQKTMYPAPRLTNQDIKRFYKHYNQGEDHACWNWKGYLRNGYGEFKIQRITYPASRIAWLINNGSLPNDKLVLHKCDNTQCVNPFHLWIGTHKDNMRDKKLKGRARVNVGINHPLAKLNDGYVIDIRYLYKTKRYSQNELAKMYDISRSGIEMALNHNWKHIEP